MLHDNPVLLLLGRKGRAAVVEALVRNPRRAWGVRDLARLADVAPMAASRAVKELAAVGAVAVERRGREAEVRFLPESPVGAFLVRLDVPDPRTQT